MSGASTSLPLLLGILSLIILIPILGCGTGDFADRVSEEGTPASTSPDATESPEATEAPATGQTGVDLRPDSIWGDAFPTFSSRSQECIRTEFAGDELSSVLERPIAIQGETERWQVTMFRCVEHNEANYLYVLGLAANAQRDGQNVTEEAKACWADFISDGNFSIPNMVEADLPENRAGAGDSPDALSYRLSICIYGNLADGGRDPRELAYRSVSAGGDHSCGVTPGSLIICWGGRGLWLQPSAGPCFQAGKHRGRPRLRDGARQFGGVLGTGRPRPGHRTFDYAIPVAGHRGGTHLRSQVRLGARVLGE